MKKIIFGIFAHPDDESFGPSGTLLRETRSGSELHLLTLTLGEAGTNPDNHPDLGTLRQAEWQAASTLLDARSTHFLGYHDGQLNNQTMIEASHKIVAIVTDILKNTPGDAIVEFITMDTNGITGHIDHIVAARAACWAFYTLRLVDARLSRIRLACLSAETHPHQNMGWLYMEPGHDNNQIDETVDARDLHDDIIEIIRTHHSQRTDGENLIASSGDQLGLDHFIVKQ